jgi:staphylococcal nuclease domain-containing protein 1
LQWLKKVWHQFTLVLKSNLNDSNIILLATIPFYFSTNRSEHYRVLKAAEDKAKAIKKNIWANYVEEVPEEKMDDYDDEKDDKVVERKVNYEKVVVTEVTSELHFFAQHTDQGAKLEALMQKLRQDFKLSPPLTGSYNPKRGELCAAK